MYSITQSHILLMLAPTFSVQKCMQWDNSQCQHLQFGLQAISREELCGMVSWSMVYEISTRHVTHTSTWDLAVFPWLIEPLLGTFALRGIGLIAARLYDQRVATLAVLLGVLSPFYSYLAASYLSHAIALFYLVWGLWALLRFAQGETGWNMLLSAACFGMAGLTRDLDAVFFVALMLPGIMLLTKRRWYKNKSRWIIPGLVFAATIAFFIGITMLFNRALTGSAWITPRTLFSGGTDRGALGKE